MMRVNKIILMLFLSITLPSPSHGAEDIYNAIAKLKRDEYRASVDKYNRQIQGQINAVESHINEATDPSLIGKIQAGYSTLGAIIRNSYYDTKLPDVERNKQALEDSLKGVTDPGLRQEILDQIATGDQVIKAATDELNRKTEIYRNVKRR